MPDTVPTPQAITVTIDGPAGLPKMKASLFVRPETAEEFEAVVEALGGPAAFRHYRDADYVTADLADEHTLFLHQPNGEPGAVPVARYPFMHAFAERIAEAQEPTLAEIVERAA